ncbi:cytochrome P450 [Saccharothrix sp. NPDC042600]|uniref:cytochrome P450 n=1 Tax=Saccharothrix TaxID=2071 RepID=UPI0033C36A9F|nr:cytochrome P450 [Saccharothrix mutabilis subsp. capreolus]
MTARRLPPFAPAGWPVERVADPYPVYRRYRERDPVHRGAGLPGTATAWYAFRHADVVRVLGDDGFGRSAHAVTHADGRTVPPVPPGYDRLSRVVANWLVFMDPPKHRRLRMLLAPRFGRDSVRALRPRVAAIAFKLVRALREQPVFDLVDAFAAPLPLLVIAEVLGLPASDVPWLRGRAVALQEAGTTQVGRGADAYARADHAASQLTDYFLGEGARRRRSGGDDLIAVLARGEGRLSEDEFTGTCIHLLTAGHETTTNLIGKSVLALLANPGALGAGRALPVGAVDELIRYDAPVQMVTRWAYRDTVLGERTVRRGDKVVLVLGSANRDPRRFRDPDVLRLDRRPAGHCGFGMGIHYCLGALLAKAEAQIGLDALAQEGLLTGGLAARPVFGADLVFHGPTHLLLRAGPRGGA